MRGAQPALLRALESEPIIVEHSASRTWASAGTHGECHRLELRLADRKAEDLLAGLSEREFALDGHFVADIAAVAVEWQGCEARLVIEALTIALD